MGTSFLVGLAVAWAVIGVVLSVVMGRRGHDPFVWLALGLVLGPFAVPLAFERLRDRPLHVAPRHEAGDCDVLAGVDGSKESATALHDALEVLGERVTSVTIATVVDHDNRDTPAGEEVREDARLLLAGVAEGLGVDEVRTEVLYGRPDQALTSFADAAGIELIVIGARGRGASKAVFGSVAGRLVGASSVPVLVGRKTSR